VRGNRENQLLVGVATVRFLFIAAVSLLALTSARAQQAADALLKTRSSPGLHKARSRDNIRIGLRKKAYPIGRTVRQSYFLTGVTDVLACQNTRTL
jgi:hypothetical protein